MIDITEISGYLQNAGPILLIFYVLLIVGQWKVFEKAGEAGWKSLIPIYNLFVLWKIAGKSFGRLILTIIVGYLIAALCGILLKGAGVLIAAIIILAIGIDVIVETARFCGALSKSFGHGSGFAVGLFFLQPIFLMILGLGSSSYQK